MYAIRDENGKIKGECRWPCFDDEGNRLCDLEPIDKESQEWLDYIESQ